MDHESSQYFHIAKKTMERIARRRLQRSEKALLQERIGALTERKTMKKTAFWLQK